MKKTKVSNNSVSTSSLEDVWKWKEAVHKDIKDMSRAEVLKYFRESTKDVIKKLGLKKAK